MTFLFETTFCIPALVEIPLLTGFMTQFLRHDRKLRGFLNQGSFFLTAACLILTLSHLSQGQPLQASSWMNGLFEYHVSPINSIFALLSFVCVSLTLYYQCQQYQENCRGHRTALLWWLLGLMNGFFLTDSVLALFVFFEASLIPLFYWVHSQKSPAAKKAAVKMFLYTAIGSTLLLIGILFVLANAPIEYWSLSTLSQANVLSQAPFWLGCCFLMAFLVKLPLWPFHAWLPHAHSEAPTSASVLLAAVMLKMGGYGMLRISVPLFPEAIKVLTPFLYTASLIGIIPVAVIAWVQADMKRLVAYSSISHMAFVVLALTLARAPGPHQVLSLQGALMQMISHGLISAALFFCVGFLYDRYHTRAMSFYGGLGKKLPQLCAYMTFFLLANAAVPGLSGFMGELSILLACFECYPALAIVAASSLFLSAMVNLRLLTALFYGVESSEMQNYEDVSDCLPYEHHILLVLALGVLLLGVFPQILWGWSQAEALELVALVNKY